MAIFGHLIPPSTRNSDIKGESNARNGHVNDINGSQDGGEKGYFLHSENGISRFS